MVDPTLSFLVEEGAQRANEGAMGYRVALKQASAQDSSPLNAESHSLPQGERGGFVVEVRS